MSTEKKRHLNFKDQTGHSFTTNQGYKATVIRYENCHDCDIEFDFGLILKNMDFYCVKRCCILNPFHRSVNNWGYIGIGSYKTGSKAHKIWMSMLNRVQNHSNYFDCSIIDEWSCFQVFAEWYENNFNPEIMRSWHLDKDILIKGSKIYSPETCCFVPQEINKLFTKCNKSRGELPIGVRREGNKYVARINSTIYLGIFDTIEEAFNAYKTAKEKYIKTIADKWKPLISDKVYEVMYNYRVEITD